MERFGRLRRRRVGRRVGLLRSAQTRASAGAAAVCLGVAAGAAHAGDEPFVEALVIKTDLNVQTGPATVVDAALSAVSAPWILEASVSGIDLANIGPVTVDGPFAGSPASLAFTPGTGGIDWDAWQFFDGAGSRAALDTAYPDGTYTISATAPGVGAVPFSVDLTGGLFPASSPLVALTGGSWAGGQYRVPLGQNVNADVAGFDISNLPTGATSQAIIIELFDPSDARINVAEVNSVDHPGASSVGMNFTPTVPGTYELQAFFGTGVDETEDEVLGVDAAAGYAQQTSVFLHVFTDAGPTGDHDGSGQVEQGDLDLVLQNWGLDTDAIAGGGIPTGWTNDLPDGLIDQAELDGVLLNWGGTASPEFSGATHVPEPGFAWLVCTVGWGALTRGVRSRLRFTEQSSEPGA